MKSEEAKKEKKKLNKLEYHPEKYTEKFIAAKIIFILFQIILFSLTFSIMYMIITKKILNSAASMFSCSNKMDISYFKLFFISFIAILIFIIILTIILYLLNRIFGIKITFKEALSIVASSYFVFTIGSVIVAILFLIGWSYLGYILLIATFFLTQFNVYQTYYSVVEKHEKINNIIVAVIYVITSITAFIILNITLFNYLKDLYTKFC